MGAQGPRVLEKSRPRGAFRKRTAPWRTQQGARRSCFCVKTQASLSWELPRPSRPAWTPLARHSQAGTEGRRRERGAVALPCVWEAACVRESRQEAVEAQGRTEDGVMPEGRSWWRWGSRGEPGAEGCCSRGQAHPLRRGELRGPAWWQPRRQR